MNKKTTKYYLHSDKESNNWYWVDKLGGTYDDPGLQNFKYAFREVEFDIEVDLDTGEYRILSFKPGNGQPIMYADNKANYQYSEYQIHMHQAQCFCMVPDCPYCFSISKAKLT